MPLDQLMNAVIEDSCTSHNDPSAFFNPSVWGYLQNDLGFHTGDDESRTLPPSWLHLSGYGHDFMDDVTDITGLQEQRAVLAKLEEHKRLLEDTSIDVNIVTPASILKERRHLKADTIILTTWISTHHTPLVETIQNDDDDNGIAVNTSTLQGKRLITADITDDSQLIITIGAPTTPSTTIVETSLDAILKNSVNDLELHELGHDLSNLIRTRGETPNKHVHLHTHLDLKDKLKPFLNCSTSESDNEVIIVADTGASDGLTFDPDDFVEITYGNFGSMTTAASDVKFPLFASGIVE